MTKHYSYTSPDDPEPLDCDQCAVYAEKADYWLAAKERTDSYLDAEMDRRRAAEAERDELRAEVERLRAAANFAANAADGFRAEADALRAERDTAIRMLAEWCVAVDENGAAWDNWDHHYKNAMHRPGPLRELLDAAIDAARCES